MALTDLQVRTAKPKEKAYKMADAGGLFLLVATLAVSGGDLSIESGARKNSSL